MMANGMMNITIGNIVVGADFFDREDVIENIWETLQTDSILLAAPRRVGKSSIMRRLFDQPRFGFRPIWLDCQDYGGPEDLVTDLTVKACAQIGSRKHRGVGNLAAEAEIAGTSGRQLAVSR
jgi:hypothetical protein